MRALTVVCTFRNAAATLRDTVESLLRQTQSNFSCVLVDDQSTDGSAAIAREISGQDPRFRLVHNRTPGRAQALNLGVALCETDWFAILDADDVAHPEWIQRMAVAPTGAAALGCRLRWFRDNNLPEWTAMRVEAPVLTIVTRQLVRSNPIGHSGCVFLKAAVISINGYDLTRLSQFDYDLYVRLAVAGYSIARLEQELVGHRVHAGQSFEASDHLLYIWRSVQVQLRAIALFRSRPYYYFWPLLRLSWACLPRFARLAMRGAKLALSARGDHAAQPGEHKP